MSNKDQILKYCGLDTAMLDDIRIADGNNKTLLKRIYQAMDMFLESKDTIQTIVDELRGSEFIHSVSIIDKEVIIRVWNNIAAIDFAKKYISARAINFFDMDTIIHSTKVQTFYCIIKPND